MYEQRSQFYTAGSTENSIFAENLEAIGLLEKSKLRANGIKENAAVYATILPIFDLIHTDLVRGILPKSKHDINNDK